MADSIAMATNTQWEPIKRREVAPTVEALPNHRVRLGINLTRSPDATWSDFFHRPIDVPISLSSLRPSIEGSSVTVTTTDERFEATIVELLARIDAANRMYEEQVLPKLRSERRQKDQDEAHRQRRQTILEEQARKLLRGEPNRDS
jgi:hypothetical protein